MHMENGWTLNILGKAKLFLYPNVIRYVVLFIISLFNVLTYQETSVSRNSLILWIHFTVHGAEQNIHTGSVVYCSLFHFPERRNVN